jgi:4-amino-4-deoxy-L-arabinose transferase-like glycosyltransferase
VTRAEVESESDPSSRRLWPWGAGFAVGVVAAVKLVLHLYAGRHYGYFGDELYYLACARHLAWGYVDQPPLIALVAWLEHALLGDSLSAIRFLPALSGAAKVLLTGLMARELGGGRFAQGLAALCVLLAPGMLALDHFLSMNAFEPLFWMGCAYLVLRIIRTGNAKLWLCFGALAGVGLENKYSMLIFGFGIVAGLVLTRERRWLRSPWFWAGGAIAFLIFLPNLLWNIQNHFPFLELQANIRRSGRDVALSPLVFFGEEILAMLPLSAPIWLAGLWYLFFHRDGKQFRVLGWAWAVTAGTIMMFSPRIYYLFPAYPVLFAAGSVVWERWLAGARAQWIKPVYVALMVLMGALLAPTLLPLLPPETCIRYAAAIHVQQPRIENHRLGPLPQLFADQFGWEEMAAAVAGAYNSLPADVRARTAIFGQNYGQAGAIDLFGPKYGIPQGSAISGHQSYYLWGPHGFTGESMIVMDDRPERLAEIFTTFRKVARVWHPYSMPYQHFDVYYCEGMKEPLSKLWPQVKKWD